MIEAISDISLLPSIVALKKTSQAIAFLDAILSPEWQYRYFSFNNNWDRQAKEMMASMRDGEGSEYFILFMRDGVAGKVCSDIILPNPRDYLELMPDSFSSFKNEPAFSIEKATFFFWNMGTESTHWNAVPNNIEEYPLLDILLGDPKTYHEWAQDYYEKDIPIAAIEHAFETLTLDTNFLEQLNPNMTAEDLKEDIQEIFGSYNPFV